MSVATSTDRAEESPTRQVTTRDNTGLLLHDLAFIPARDIAKHGNATHEPTYASIRIDQSEDPGWEPSFTI